MNRFFRPKQPFKKGHIMPKLDAALMKRNAAAIAAANPHYDQINRNWAKVEEFLKVCGVLAPVELWLYADESCAESGIGICKSGGKWRVHRIYFHPQNPSREAEWTLIGDTPVETRVAMLEHIPELFEKLVETNEKTVVDLVEAANKSSEALKALGIS